MTRFLLALVAPAIALSTPVFANCVVQDRSGTETELVRSLGETQDELAGARATGKLWEFWLKAPNETAQDLLDRGMANRESWALEDSEALLDQLIAYCPDYGEGYNQRAFTRFLRDDYEGALADIEEVLKRHPNHFGALSGKALSLMRQGRVRLAQIALRRAVDVNPWLRERSMLVDPPGRKI